VENWSLNPRPTGQFTVTNGRVSDIVAKLDASIAARPARSICANRALALRSRHLAPVRLKRWSCSESSGQRQIENFRAAHRYSLNRR